MFDLVSATVAQITVIIIRCTTEVINIKRAAVSHLNVGGPVTTTLPAKVDLPGYSAVSDCRMTSVQPAGGACVTAIDRWT